LQLPIPVQSLKDKAGAGVKNFAENFPTQLEKKVQNSIRLEVFPQHLAFFFSHLAEIAA
jgi:hypothetical protein